MLGAFRLVTDVAAMLACEHRLRPRPFLGVLPRNCTSYSSRDRATSAILSDDHQDGRPTSAPVWCRSVSRAAVVFWLALTIIAGVQMCST